MEIVKAGRKEKSFYKDRNVQDKIDGIITHKIIGIPIFAAVIFLVFYISQTTLGTWIADWLVAWIETFQGWVGGLMENANPLLYALLVDGIIGGVGAVVGFLPLVMVMYFLIALLEDCGYMARATVVLDPIFKRVGFRENPLFRWSSVPDVRFRVLCLAVRFVMKESAVPQRCLHHLCHVGQKSQ